MDSQAAMEAEWLWREVTDVMEAFIMHNPYEFFLLIHLVTSGPPENVQRTCLGWLNVPCGVKNYNKNALNVSTVKKKFFSGK